MTQALFALSTFFLGWPTLPAKTSHSNPVGSQEARSSQR